MSSSLIKRAVIGAIEVGLDFSLPFELLPSKAQSLARDHGPFALGTGFGSVLTSAVSVATFVISCLHHHMEDVFTGL